MKKQHKLCKVPLENSKYYYLYIENQCDICNVVVKEGVYVRDPKTNEFPNLSNYIYSSSRKRLNSIKRQFVRNVKCWFRLCVYSNWIPKKEDPKVWLTTDSRCHLKTIHPKEGTGSFYPCNYFKTISQAQKMQSCIVSFFVKKGITFTN